MEVKSEDSTNTALNEWQSRAPVAHMFIEIRNNRWGLGPEVELLLLTLWIVFIHQCQVLVFSFGLCITYIHKETLMFFCAAFSVLKDQWIHAKYERREFTGENNFYQQVYSSGNNPAMALIRKYSSYWQHVLNLHLYSMPTIRFVAFIY